MDNKDYARSLVSRAKRVTIIMDDARLPEPPALGPVWVTVLVTKYPPDTANVPIVGAAESGP